MPFIFGLIHLFARAQLSDFDNSVAKKHLMSLVLAIGGCARMNELFARPIATAPRI